MEDAVLDFLLVYEEMRDLPRLDIPKELIVAQFELEPLKRAILAAVIDYYPAAAPRSIFQDSNKPELLAWRVSATNRHIRKHGFYIKSHQFRGYCLTPLEIRP